MFVYKVMNVLVESGGSVSFALPDSRIHAVMSIVPEGKDVFLHLKMLRQGKAIEGGRAIEGEVHRAESLEDMKAFLKDERNEAQVRFAIRKLWDWIEGRKS